MVLFGQQKQLFQLGQQFVHHTLVLGAHIARVDGGKFHRNAVAVVHPYARRIFADGMNGVYIILIITLGIRLRHRRFAQHIE